MATVSRTPSFAGPGEATQAETLAAGIEADRKSVMAVAMAVEAQTEQASIIDSAPIAQRYQAGLTEAIAAKYEQVERIEGNLETQVEAQESKLQLLSSQQPGFFAGKAARLQWQSAQQREQAVLQRLHGRLETVREIKDAMGLRAPKVEELAEQQFRKREPELAESWDQMRAAQRGHEALMRRQEQERRRQQNQGQEQGRGLGHSLALLLTPGRS